MTYNLLRKLINFSNVKVPWETCLPLAEYWFGCPSPWPFNHPSPSQGQFLKQPVVHSTLSDLHMTFSVGPLWLACIGPSSVWVHSDWLAQDLDHCGSTLTNLYMTFISVVQSSSPPPHPPPGENFELPPSLPSPSPESRVQGFPQENFGGFPHLVTW